MEHSNEKHKAHIGKAASDLMEEGKKFAHELYEEGLYKVNEAEVQIKKHSDDLLHKVQVNPLASVLIAGGIGFLLAKLMKK